MDERRKLVALHGTGGYTVTELANHFRGRRKTAHKWLRRYAAAGEGALQDLIARAPDAPERDTGGRRHRADRGQAGPSDLGSIETEPAARCPGCSDGRLARPQHPRRHPRPGAARSSHAGAVTVSLPTRSPSRPAISPTRCGVADFKGWFRTGDGQRCDPLTITDAHSRMLLCCHGLGHGTGYAHVRPLFQRTFHEYGLPAAIRDR